MAKKPLPTPEVLRQLLTYDARKGAFTWKARDVRFFLQKSSRCPAHSAAIWNSRYSGHAAFNDLSSNGYLMGQVFKHRLLAHRVAWAMHFGEWPIAEIDHVNGIKTDNSIANLRHATRSQNNANRGANAGRKYKGVYANRSRWCAYIQHSGKTHYLGSFGTQEEAARAYDAAAMCQHGKFAAINFPISSPARRTRCGIF